MGHNSQSPPVPAEMGHARVLLRSVADVLAGAALSGFQVKFFLSGQLDPDQAQPALGDAKPRGSIEVADRAVGLLLGFAGLLSVVIIAAHGRFFQSLG